jgi:18S rRNA (guanine1575-N7)-methyltransferase
MIEIQTQMSRRAIELLCLPTSEQDGSKMILDIGCGSGLSGSVLEEDGHFWVGLDISKSMLGVLASLLSLFIMYIDVAVEREVEGDMILADMGQGLMFRPGMFDAAIRY